MWLVKWSNVKRRRNTLPCMLGYHGRTTVISPTTRKQMLKEGAMHCCFVQQVHLRPRRDHCGSNRAVKPRFVQTPQMHCDSVCCFRGRVLETICQATEPTATRRFGCPRPIDIPVPCRPSPAHSRLAGNNRLTSHRGVTVPGARKVAPQLERTPGWLNVMSSGFDRGS